MHNFRITFLHPWLLLLIIPAIALTLLPYFLLNKRYRRTRNRIISMVLHCVVMALVISVLAGISINYQVANLENEVIFLVDVSATQEDVAQRRDEFVNQALIEGSFDGFKMGVVLFGFTQEYAAPFSYEAEELYNNYLAAILPDTSATDIAAALRYVAPLFEYPETAKIVLVSDGGETDEDALEAVRTISAQGTRVDTVYLAGGFENDTVRVTDIIFPDFHIDADKPFTLSAQLEAPPASGNEQHNVTFYDNGMEIATQTVTIAGGVQLVPFEHTFTESGLHEITMEVSEDGDGVGENNSYKAYVYVESFTKVLILNSETGASAAIEGVLASAEDVKYDVTTMLINEENLPRTVDGLRAYDQIILNNIAASDMPEGFDEALYSYVNDFGGGVFTTGGDDAAGGAHAYNRAELSDKGAESTMYDDLLPVEVINYTPPVGVFFIVDVSGSMASIQPDGKSKLEWAKEGLISTFDALTDRDFIGIMTLASVYGTVLPLTPRTREDVIREAIRGINGSGGTEFAPAVDRAGFALKTEQRIDKRHIVLITDGEPADDEAFLELVDSYSKEDGITFSLFLIGPENELCRQLEAHGGKVHAVPSEVDFIQAITNDLLADEIKEVEEREFHPRVANTLSVVVSGVAYGGVEGESDRAMTATLGGFYGTRKKSSADVILEGEFEVPIYAQWKLGKGMVGSFLCDLGGKWSSAFLDDADGRKLLLNAIANLMPIENIRARNIEYSFTEENYINQLSVAPKTPLGNGEKITGRIVYTDPATREEIEVPLDGSGNRENCYVTKGGSTASFWSAATGRTTSSRAIRSNSTRRSPIPRNTAKRPRRTSLRPIPRYSSPRSRAGPTAAPSA